MSLMNFHFQLEIDIVIPIKYYIIPMRKYERTIQRFLQSGGKRI